RPLVAVIHADLENVAAGGQVLRNGDAVVVLDLFAPLPGGRRPQVVGRLGVSLGDNRGPAVQQVGEDLPVVRSRPLRRAPYQGEVERFPWPYPPRTNPIGVENNAVVERRVYFFCG